MIVDYLSDNQTTPMPDGDPNAFQKDNSFAHFARVVGFAGDNIVLAQSINPQSNGNTLSAPISDFSQAWRDPERRAFLAKLLPTVEQVNYWMLIMTAKGYQ